MPPLRNQPSQLHRGKAPDIVGTLRDWVGQDDRIAPTLVGPEPNDSSSLIDRTPADEFRQAGAPQDHSDSLAAAFEHARKLDSAPRMQDSFEPDPYQVGPDAEIAGDGDRHRPSPRLAARPPLGKEPRPAFASRLTRTMAAGIFAIALVTIAFAVISNGGIQQPGDSAQMPDIKIPATQSRSVDDANRLVQQQLALQQQLNKLSNDVAAVRRLADGLAARQEEAAQNLAKLQTAQENIREQVTALTALQSTTQLRRHRRRVAR